MNLKEISNWVILSKLKKILNFGCQIIGIYIILDRKIIINFKITLYITKCHITSCDAILFELISSLVFLVFLLKIMSVEKKKKLLRQSCCKYSFFLNNTK